MMSWLMGTTLEDIRQQRELLERGQAIREAREAEAERRRLRDKFAAAALTGLLAAEKDGSLCNDVVAKYAYAAADAMMTARGG